MQQASDMPAQQPSGSLSWDKVWQALFVLAMAAFCIWYLIDTRSSSTNIQNLLLVQPAVVGALILCAILLYGILFRRASAEVEAPEEAEDGAIADPEEKDDLRQIGLLMAFMIGYLCLIPYIGFDAASFVFMAATLLMQGERRPVIVIAVPLVAAIVMTLTFRTLMMVPIPTLLFG